MLGTSSSRAGGPAGESRSRSSLYRVFLKYLLRHLLPPMQEVSGAVKAQLEKSLEKQLEKALSASLASQLAKPLQDSFRSAFQKSLLPAFEGACQSMFGQINSSLAAGFQEHVQVRCRVCKLCILLYCSCDKERNRFCLAPCCGATTFAPLVGRGRRGNRTEEMALGR